MSDSSLFLGIDCGTQSTKVPSAAAAAPPPPLPPPPPPLLLPCSVLACSGPNSQTPPLRPQVLVYDAENREVLSRASVSYELTSNRPGQAEQAPSMWVQVRRLLLASISIMTAPHLPKHCKTVNVLATCPPVLPASNAQARAAPAALPAGHPRPLFSQHIPCAVCLTAPLQACKECIADALDGAGNERGDVAARVKALGVSGQQHGMVALDENKKVIRPGGLTEQQRCWLQKGGLGLPFNSKPPHAAAAAAACPVPLTAAKLWCDVESAAEAEELSKLWGTTIVPAVTGRQQHRGWRRLGAG